MTECCCFEGHHLGWALGLAGKMLTALLPLLYSPSFPLTSGHAVAVMATWESWIEFLAPCSGLAQPHHHRH